MTASGRTHAAGRDLVIAVASNNDTILAANLRQSPCLVDAALALHVERNAPSAGVAYNRALDATQADHVVYAHHDVYLPNGWDRLLQRRIEEVSAADPNWALIGAYGVGADLGHWGPVWSSSIGRIIGRVADRPVPIQSYDEMLIVLRRGSGLRFDEGLPGFHLFGTDIVMAAQARGMGAYCVPLPLVHNDRFHEQLGDDFVAAYRFMQRKWRSRLPVWSPVIKIAGHGYFLARERWRNRRTVGLRQTMAAGVDVPPAERAERCGWVDLCPDRDG